MRAGSLVVAVAVLGCGAVLKPPAPDRRLNVQQTGSVFEASNGYRFAVLPEPQSSIVRLDVRYPVGSAHDPKGKQGLAHLVEHLLFDVEYARGGTRTSIGAELGKVALSWNAETHPDYTSYQTLLAPEQLEEVLELEVNRLAIGCAGLTPEIFAREREVVMNELRQRQGASGAQMQRVIRDALYPEDHPYRPVDSVETVAALALKDVCDFLATHYQRGKAVVVLSGDVDERAVQRAASKQFVRLRKRNVVAIPPPPQVNPKPGTVRVRADIDEPAAFIAIWSLPPMATSDYRLLSLGWPSIAWRLEQFAYMYKWGHSSFAQVLGGAHAPMLAVGIYLRSADDVEEARSSLEKSVRGAFEAFGHNREDDRWRARFYAGAEALLSRWESLGGRNTMLGDSLMLEQTPGFLVGRIAELQRSSPSEMRRLAREWLGAQHARYLVIEPSGTLAMSSGSTYGGGAGEHATVVDATLADTPLEVPQYRPRLRTERYALENGLQVVLWPHGSTPISRGRLVVDSGTGHEPLNKEGIASLIGASDVDLDSLSFESRELSIFVDNLIVELGLELRNPGLPLDDDQKDFIKARLRNKQSAERATYETSLRAAVYGESHPYARPQMTEASVGRLHHDLVRDWARDHVVAKNSTLIITGKFDPALIKRHIAYNVDQVSAGSDSADIEVSTASAIPRYVVGVAGKPSPTVELDVSFLSRPGVDKDYAKRLVLELVLDGELSKLRGERALTYGFYASWSPRKGGGEWRVSGEADASRAAEAATALLEILAAMRADPEAYRGSFVLARQKVVERLLLAANDSASVSEQLALLARFDLEDAFLERLPDEVGRVTLADFHAFLVREIPASRQVFGAFGNEAPAKAAVAAARTFGRAP